MRRAKLILGSSACGLVVAAGLLHLCCNSKDTEASAEKSLVVFVTIAPQAYFVEKVAGGHARVEVLVAPGQSYHTFEPTQRQIEAISTSRAYFGIGVPFEAGIRDRIGSVGDRIKFVDTSEGIERRPGVECFHDDDGAAEHHHEDEEGDPHIWLDPRIVKRLAGRIEQTLSELDPDHAAEYRKNVKTFESELEAVHSKLTEMLAPCRGKSFFVFHPSFGYFGDAYGLKQEAIEEGGKEPGARQLRRLVEKAKARGARVIFVQPQFAATGAEAIARELGARLDTLDPLARDYLKNLEEMAQKIRSALVSVN
jgi:zinc transport system substrate-binding protein